MCQLTRRRSSGAFTLVELLVVIAIIGILVALLLPAVQAARESARRTQCVNNIKNLALGLHNYHDANKAFPPLVKTTSTAVGVDTRLGPNWAILTLPYLEEQSLHDRFDLDVPNARISDGTGPDRPGDWSERGTELQVMLCPTDQGAGNPFTGSVTNQGAGGIIAGSTSGNWARGNYALNGVQFWPDNYQRIDTNGRPYPDDWNVGVSSVNEGLRIGQITDGTSKTLMIAELRVGLVPEDRRGVWAMGMCGSSWHCRHATNGSTTVNDCSNDDDILMPGNVVSQQQEAFRTECMAVGYNQNSGQSVVRSLHPGGVNAALADASVRFISDFIESGVQPFQGNVSGKIGELESDGSTSPALFAAWQRLCVARDGYVVTLE